MLANCSTVFMSHTESTVSSKAQDSTAQVSQDLLCIRPARNWVSSSTDINLTFPKALTLLCSNCVINQRTRDASIYSHCGLLPPKSINRHATNQTSHFTKLLQHTQNTVHLCHNRNYLATNYHTECLSPA